MSNSLNSTGEQELWEFDDNDDEYINMKLIKTLSIIKSRNEMIQMFLDDYSVMSLDENEV